MSEPQEEEVGGKGFALVFAFLSACLLDQSVKLWVEERASSFAGESEGHALVFLSYAENSSALFGWTVGWPANRPTKQGAGVLRVAEEDKSVPLAFPRKRGGALLHPQLDGLVEKAG